VDPAIFGPELAADESACLVPGGKLDGPCKAALLVYHQAAEQGRGADTADPCTFPGDQRRSPSRVIEVDVGGGTAPALVKVKF
jgi:hypothetical protein